MSAQPEIWAVVPVKPFHLAKQRLADAWPPALRGELARLMLADVLAALRQAAGIAGIAVVTRDPDAAELARAHDAEIFAEDAGGAGGLNAAVRGAAHRLAREGRGGMLALPGDIPGITVQEIQTLLAQHRRSCGLSLVPAHDRRGTNALLLTPPDALAPAFGEDSFARHFLAGRAAGLEPAVLSLPGIGLDLDHPRDLATFARTPSATRTWRYLQAAAPTTVREPASII